MRPGFSLCICPDATLLLHEIESLLHKHPASEAWQRQYFWGDEGLGDSFWEAITLQGLIEVPKAIVVRSAQLLNADTWKRLSKTLARPLGQTWLFLCLEGAWEKGQPKILAHISKQRCFEHANKQNWIWRHGGLDARSLRAYVKARMTSLHLEAAPDVFEALCRVLPFDAAAIENELGKLALYADSGRLDMQATRLVEHSPAFDIFALLRHLQAGRAEAVWESILREESLNEDLVFPLSGLLLREARILWQLKAGEKPYLHPQEAQAKRDLAMRLGFSGLSTLWELALTAEYSIKSGQLSPQQALHALISGLTQLFPPAKR